MSLLASVIVMLIRCYHRLCLSSKPTTDQQTWTKGPIWVIRTASTTHGALPLTAKRHCFKSSAKPHQLRTLFLMLEDLQW